MQPTTRFHDGIANAIFQEAYVVFHHPILLHPIDRVFNPDSDGRDRAIARLLRWGEFPTRGCFLRLDERQPITRLPLEAQILIETNAGWDGIALQISEALIIGLPCIGSTQEAHMTGLIDDEEVVDRVASLRAPGEFLLVLGIGGAVDRALSAIMPTRGASDAPVVRSAVSRPAHSSAVRAGRSSWWANA